MSIEQPDNAKFLNLSQRGSLPTTLSTLEEMLCEIEQTVTVGCCKGVLYEMRGDLPSQVKGEILKRYIPCQGDDRDSEGGVTWRRSTRMQAGISWRNLPTDGKSSKGQS